MFEIGSRPGRDAKWKEGGTGLKAEMGKEGSSRAAEQQQQQQQQRSSSRGGGWYAPLLLLQEPTSQKLTEIWRKNFKPWH